MEFTWLKLQITSLEEADQNGDNAEQKQQRVGSVAEQGSHYAKL